LSSSTPVSVSGLGGILSLVAGAYHTCAVASDGAAYCWGYNSDGELGDGTQIDSSLPSPVLGFPFTSGGGAR
jgi:alpha-tubulin suppressor-like RCC1 family protein